KHGLVIDNLESAEVVTADGHRITASDREHSDLFWALRGGGGNFGVVTSFKYRLHRIGPAIVDGMLTHDVSDAAALLRFYRDFSAQAPDEFGGLVTFWTAPTAP